MDILIDDVDSIWAESGDNVKLKLRNIEEEDISAGILWVLSYGTHNDKWNSERPGKGKQRNCL